jgi:DNA-binding MurR/RpiR family transcriptional regulator
MEKERQEAELEAAKDEPDKLAKIRLQQELKKRESDLAKAQDELNNATTKINELTSKDKEINLQTSVKEIAKKMGVSEVTLSKLAKFTDGTVEAIEELAKDLPKQDTKLEPDDNRSHGGSPQSVNQIRSDYIAGKINSVQYAEKLKAVGAQP